MIAALGLAQAARADVATPGDVKDAKAGRAVVDRESEIELLVCDGATLFYAAGGELRAVATSGGAPRTIASGLSPEALAVDAHDLWFLDYVGAGELSAHALRRVDKRGGDVVTVSKSLPVGSSTLAVDGEYVYFATEHGLGRIPKRGGEDHELYAHEDSGPSGIAVDGEFVYFSDGGALFRLPKRGGRPRKLAATWSKQWAVDARWLYGLDEHREQVRVFRVSKRGGAQQDLLAPYGEEDELGGLAIDASSLYVARRRIFYGPHGTEEGTGRILSFRLGR
jgi:hypothetical protein